jgi:hypothetical protein
MVQPHLHREKASAMKIGIGISTYNRLFYLKQVVQCVKQYTMTPYSFIVSSDGSVDGTNQWLLKNQIPCILGPNKGVCYNKNRILTALQHCDYVLLLEDDICPKNKGWMGAYLQGISDSGYQHFCYKMGRVTRATRVQYPKCALLLSHNVSGLLMIFTKQVLERCGGFNLLYSGYGYGHIEMSMRIMQAGLSHKTLFADVLEGHLNMRVLPDLNQLNVMQQKSKMKKCASNKRRLKQFKKWSTKNPEQYRYCDYHVPIKIYGAV